MRERLPNDPTPKLDETAASFPNTENPEAVANIRIEQLKALGIIKRESQTTDEWEQDNHFDTLADEFAHLAALFGVA